MIYGIDPSSMIDYPGKLSFVIFLGGCNFRCPYCHNKDIVNKKNNTYEKDNILRMLSDRTKLIKAVVITGGEPTIYGAALIDLIKEIKFLGYLVKLDTNGSNPDLLKEIIDNNLVDYIAMDIKNTFAKYKSTVGVNIDINKIKKSIKFIEAGNINYEFRTTINKDMHSERDIEEIFTYIKDKSKLVLQSYRYSSEQLKDIEYKEYSKEELEELKNKFEILIR